MAELNELKSANSAGVAKVSELGSIVKDTQGALDAAKADAASQKQQLAAVRAEADEARSKVHRPTLFASRAASQWRMRMKCKAVVWV